MMRVEVYWNLHKNCWSIRHAHGKLIADRPHRHYVELAKVDWVVQKGGRERVLREGKKNVHAFARGVLMGLNDIDCNYWGYNETKQVTYNPYKLDHFVDRKTEEPVRKSALVVMAGENVEGTKRPRTCAL